MYARVCCAVLWVCQVIHYQAGQHYAGHYDAYNKSTEKGQRTTKDGGNRLLTVLCYLTNVAEGGATGLPKLALEVTSHYLATPST